MSLVKQIHVQNVRTHEDYTIELSPSVTVITGSNGSGKTTLIEALYIALQGSSFKGSDANILRNNAPWYRIDVYFDDDRVITVKFDPTRSVGRKQYVIDGKTHYRLSQQYKNPVVLFEPDDLRLLNGSPTRRREFIDRFISQLDPQYLVALRRYDRALKQRNNLLKRTHVSSNDLFAWDISLSDYGAYIMKQRLYYINQLDARFNQVYNTISPTNDTVNIRYSHSAHAAIQHTLLADLDAHIEKDKLLGFTSVGPHRHDVVFSFNGSPALSVASRGETRSIVLALKFLEVSNIEQITNINPIILLDDVFSELDKQRQGHLLVNDNHQVIITSTSYSEKLPRFTKLIELD